MINRRKHRIPLTDHEFVTLITEAVVEAAIVCNEPDGLRWAAEFGGIDAAWGHARLFPTRSGSMRWPVERTSRRPGAPCRFVPCGAAAAS